MFQSCPYLSLDRSIAHSSPTIPWVLQSPSGLLQKSHVSSWGYLQSSLRAVSPGTPIMTSPEPLAEICRSRLITELNPGNPAAPNLGGLGIGKPIKLLMQRLLTDFTYLRSPHTQLPASQPEMECRRVTHVLLKNLATSLQSPGQG